MRLLIFVGWIPPCMVASCPHGLGSDFGAGLPLRPSATLSCVGRLARFLTTAGRPGGDGKELNHGGLTGTCRSKAQTKPQSSRASATVTFGFISPRPSRCRLRLYSRVCTFQLSSRYAGGSPCWRRASGADTFGGRKACCTTSTRIHRA